jgi:hypothetical protein
MKFFYVKLEIILFLLCLFTFILVVFIASNKKLESFIKQKTIIKDVKINSLLNTDEFSTMKYDENNLSSFASLCSKDCYSYLRNNLLLENVSKMDAELVDQISESVEARLEMDTKNCIVYTLNNKIIWTSETPRTHVDCIESKVLKSSIAIINDLNNWKFIHESPDKNIRLHMKPLAITYAHKNTRFLLWTFLSGWDTASLCALEEKNCKIPLALKELRNEDNAVHGKIILSQLSHQLALLNNGDLVIVKKNKIEENYVIKKSLMQEYCNPKFK